MDKKFDFSYKPEVSSFKLEQKPTDYGSIRASPGYPDAGEQYKSSGYY